MDDENIAQSYPLSAEAILLPIFSSLAIILLIVPFIWHWRLRNIGACSLIFYISLTNLFTFINVIIWPTEEFDSWWNGAGLCDIEVKLKWPCVTGLACATFCITRNLANVLDVDRTEIAPTRASTRRKVAVDVAICFTVPVLQIALHYIIQVNRYYITAIGGCAPSYDNSWPTVVIMFMWPLIFCLINCYYAVLVIYRLRKYRSSFSAILSSSSSNLTTARFLRLFIMSFTLLLIYTPVSIYFFYVNLDIEWLSYSWSVIHDPSTWWVILYFPALGVRTFDCWVSIAMAIFVFAYFGMGGDAVDTYRRWMVRIGLGRLFPSLKLPRQRRASSGNRSWASQLSLVSRAKQYFSVSRKGSDVTTLMTSGDQTSTTRKLSIITAEHIVPVTTFGPSPLSQTPTITDTTSLTHIYAGETPKSHVKTHIWASSLSPSSSASVIPTKPPSKAQRGNDKMMIGEGGEEGEEKEDVIGGVVLNKEGHVRVNVSFDRAVVVR